MLPALQLRAVHKRFAADVGRCLLSVDVLRGIDLELKRGQSVGIVGPPGAGKSTLMLCAAGLLKIESGEINWFGDASIAAAAHRARYCCNPADLPREHCPDEPRLHLIDFHSPCRVDAAVAAWIAEQCARGDAVMAVACDERVLARAVQHVFALSAGKLYAPRLTRLRVAECATG